MDVAAVAQAAVAEQVGSAGRNVLGDLLGEAAKSTKRAAKNVLRSANLINPADGTCGVDDLLRQWCHIEYDTIDEFEQVENPCELARPCVLRACVHSGFQLPDEASYVALQILSNAGCEEQIHQSRVVPACQHHVWEFCVEERIAVTGCSLRFQIEVFGSRPFLPDRLLGKVEVPLPQAPMSQPQRQRLLLRDARWAASGCGAPKEPQLLVTWEVCENAEGRPDLVQLAEMGDIATAVRSFVVEARLAGGDLGNLVDMDLLKQEQPIEVEPIIVESKNPESGEQEDEWLRTWRWELQESRAALLAYSLRVDLRSKRANPQSSSCASASWQDSLGSLMHEIDQAQKPVLFEAELAPTQGDMKSEVKKTAKVRFSLDVHSKQPWMATESRAEPWPGTGAVAMPLTGTRGPCQRPTDQGALGRCSHLARYYCSILAEGLPPNQKVYARVVVGASAQQGEENDEEGPSEASPNVLQDVGPGFLCGGHTFAAARDNETDAQLVDFDMRVEWRDFQVVVPMLEQRMRVQIWSRVSTSLLGSGYMHEEDKLLCQALVGNMVPNRVYWWHCYGGAQDATWPDEARQMMLGVIRPPSTFCCSIGLQFSALRSHQSRGKISQWEQQGAESERRFLVVRLFRGLYLSALAGKRVTVNVELAGHQSGDPSSSVRLSFPGKVSSTGVLRFYAPASASHGGSSFFSRSPSLKTAIVERCSAELVLRPGVTHAYVYVVEEGHEAQPPRIFGRLRLNRGKRLRLGEDEWTGRSTLRWRRLRFDSSVAPLPQVRYNRELAGCILGCAALVPYGVEVGQDGWLPDQGIPRSAGCCLVSACRGSGRVPLCRGVRVPGRLPEARRPLVYHIDVLAARALHATGDEGLCTACYRIRVEGKTLEGDRNVPQSLNPTYWSRAAVLVETDGLGTPPPPVLIELFDPQADVELGNILIKDPPKIDASSDEELNRSLKAFWHALDSAGIMPFEAAAAIQAPKSSPRLLLAMGYADVPAPDMSAPDDGAPTQSVAEASRRPIPADEKACYRLSIALLGLRGLPSEVHWPELVISPFAEHRHLQPVHVPVKHGGHRLNPNFACDGGPEGGVGAHLQGSICQVPVIPYLQPPGDSGKREPTVLLPDLVLHLEEGSKKFGALSLPLCEHMSNLCDQESFAELERVEDADEVDSGQLDDDAYTVFVDIFAAEKGDMLWNDKLAVGRNIMEHRLFDIAPKADARPTPQYFNSEDFMLNGEAGFKEPFHRRVSPIFRCQKWDAKDGWSTTRTGEEAERAESWPRNLFSAVPGVMGASVGIDTEGLEKWLDRRFDKPSRTVFTMLRAHGWRCVSHLTAPERDPSLGKIEDRLQHLRDTSDLNLQTFVRPVGHQVHEPGEHGDGNSRYLARLWVTPGRLEYTVVKQGGFFVSLTRSFSSGSLNSLGSSPWSGRQEGFAHVPGLFYYKSKPEGLADGRRPSGQSVHGGEGCGGEFAPWGSTVFGVDEGDGWLKVHEKGYLPMENLRVQPPPPHFLVVKFHKPGIVIWAPPEDTCEWHGAGQVLFLVRLVEEPDTVVQVVLPSFDARFPLEATWHVRKTLTTHWSDVDIAGAARKHLLHNNHDRSHKKTYARRLAYSKTNFYDNSEFARSTHRRKLQKLPLGGFEVDVGRADKPKARHNEGSHRAGEAPRHHEAYEEARRRLPNGYTRPIAVQKHAFVCRVVRRSSQHYDRPQTRNWFREVLSETFPEVRDHPQGAPGLDRVEVKKIFMSQCTNLRNSFIHGDHEEEVCMVKGHIQVHRLRAHELQGACRTWRWGFLTFDDGLSQECSRRATVRQGPGSEGSCAQEIVQLQGQQLMAALKPEWQATELAIDVYALTASGLQPSSIGHQVYLVATVPGSGYSPQLDLKLTSTPVECHAQGTALFYHLFKLRRITLPGPCTLQIQVWQKHVPFEKQLAVVEFDLEDRWLALQQRRVRGASTVGRVSRGGEATQVQQPMEYRELLLPGAREEEGVGQAGEFRLWMDMYPEGEQRRPQNIKHESYDMQIRIIVKNVTSITVFKDWAQRNDLKVRGVFYTRNYLNQEHTDVVETDVHPWAREQASFNWQWIFHVKAPMTMCSLNLSLIDVDLFGEDLVYHPEDLALDHDLYQSCLGETRGARSLVVYFNAAAEDELLADCSDICFPCLEWRWFKRCGFKRCVRWVIFKLCCIRRDQDSAIMKPAKLHLEVEILPWIIAEATPAVAGCIEPPRGRIGWSMAVEDPVGYMKTACGPRLFKNSVRLLCCSSVVLVALVLLSLLFLLRQTFG